MAPSLFDKLGEPLTIGVSLSMSGDNASAGQRTVTKQAISKMILKPSFSEAVVLYICYTLQ